MRRTHFCCRLHSPAVLRLSPVHGRELCSAMRQLWMSRSLPLITNARRP